MLRKVNSPTLVLLVIVIAQFLCTSLWFAGNAIISDLMQNFDFPEHSVGFLTSVIQFGFITGTLCYALLNIADRHSPSLVFLCSALLAAASNLIMSLSGLTFGSALISRFLTGFFLAGIYPVGMKIAADHFDKSLGKSLGYLVGALVLGTALPHLIRNYLGSFSYRYVVYGVSLLAILGGFLIGFLISDGPFRKPSKSIQLSKTFKAFSNSEFRAAAFGYFGHMWELYAYFAFVPTIMVYWSSQSNIGINVSLWSFIIIGAGGVGCFITGYLSRFFRPKVLATIALSISGSMCLFSPFLIGLSSMAPFLFLLLVWGTTISADSPMFSTLVAQNAIPELKGTALTMVNCIGFALTIVSIQLLGWLAGFISFQFLFLILSIGPIFGLISLWRKKST